MLIFLVLDYNSTEGLHLEYKLLFLQLLNLSFECLLLNLVPMIFPLSHFVELLFIVNFHCTLLVSKFRFVMNAHVLTKML